MPDTKGVRRKPIKLTSGDEVHVFSNAEILRVQLRHQAKGEEHSIEPSFKIAVELSPAEAVELAGELLSIAQSRLPLLIQQLTPQPITEFPQPWLSPSPDATFSSGQG